MYIHVFVCMNYVYACVLHVRENVCSTSRAGVHVNSHTHTERNCTCRNNTQIHQQIHPQKHTQEHTQEHTHRNTHTETHTHTHTHTHRAERKLVLHDLQILHTQHLLKLKSGPNQTFVLCDDVILVQRLGGKKPKGSLVWIVCPVLRPQNTY
jgi:hypothetical protein